MKLFISQADNYLKQARQMMAEADPNMDIVPGVATPYPIELASNVCTKMKNLTASLTMMKTCAIGSVQRQALMAEKTKRVSWPELAARPTAWTSGQQSNSRSRLMNINAVKNGTKYKGLLEALDKTASLVVATLKNSKEAELDEAEGRRLNATQNGKG